MLKYFYIKGKKSGRLPTGKSIALSRNKQKGFTLITVLLLSSLASILVLNSLKDNVNQERLSGNFQKEINARLASEQGIFASITALTEALANNQNATIADLLALGVQNGSTDLGADHTTLNHGGTTYSVVLSQETPDELLLTSNGSRFEGKNVLKARFKIIRGSGGAPSVPDAIVGCDAVDLSGSGKIDSYDSSDPTTITYSKDWSGNITVATTAGSDGDVTTINHQGADVTLGGNSPIMGDISSTGKVIFNTSSVIGNVHANGDVIIRDSGNTQRVSGNVRTRSNFELTGGTIGEHVHANGKITLTRAVIDTKDINDINDPDIKYGGDYSATEIAKNYTGSRFNTNPMVEEVKNNDSSASGYDAKDPATNCDYLSITSEINKVDDGNSSLAPFESRGWGDDYTMLQDKLYLNANSGNTLVSSVNSNVFDIPTAVLKVKEFKVKGDHILVRGDVTLFVENNFEMSGNAKITIEKDSSLTLIIKGSVNVGGGAKIIAEQHGFTASGIPAMRIFSSYGGSGINIDGDSPIYAQIYAPFSDVSISGSGALYGAVRGKSITVSGNSTIHYDAALSKGSSSNDGGSNNSQSRIAFLGFQY